MEECSCTFIASVKFDDDNDDGDDFGKCGYGGGGGGGCGGFLAVTFSSLARILGECSTIHSPHAFFKKNIFFKFK